MEENKKIIKRLKSCFICDVEIYDDYIIIGDAKSNQYVIRKSDKDAIESFATWFKHVYIKCIPQVLSVIDYKIEMKNDYEAINVVNKIISSSKFVDEHLEDIATKTLATEA